MESPGPGHGHRGFLVQRNHESGGIVIGVILPLGAALQQRVEATSCNRDIFTILKSGQCSFQIQPLTHAPLPLPENHTQAISSFFETASLKSTDLKVDSARVRWTARWRGKNGHQHDQGRRGAVANRVSAALVCGRHVESQRIRSRGESACRQH